MKQIYLLFALLIIAHSSSLSAQQKPKLILQITVDQLRADLPMKVYDRLPAGGFKYLYEQGIVYENAYHRHANTETVVGHTTLATGADPSAHGMIGNIWFDTESKQTVYNVQDINHPLLGEGSGVDKKTEIDPTQAAATTDGRSPAAILGTTFSDELAMFTNGKAKIFGVSIKDRGAITLAGHAGKAFWFSKAKGEFVTSTYYYEDYPNWVKKWNAQKKINSYLNTSWELMHDRATYTYGEEDDMPWETKFPGYGVVFPHPFGEMSKYFTTFLTLSPVGDELTLDFAKTLIEAENIGSDSITDYLSISFSSTDYVGHVFGPSSLEGEDNLFRLDRTLANLLTFVDEKVGLKNTLIVLSADHGGVDAPGYMKKFGIDAGYFDIDAVDTLSIKKVLQEEFQVTDKLVSGYFHPYVYLDKQAIAKNNLDIDAVSRVLAAELRKEKGIADAIASADLLEGNLSQTPLNTAVLRNYNPKRSGEIYLVFEPYWFINDFDGLTVATTHGSPWKYDQHVPVIFIGSGLEAAKIYRRVETVDVATTLSHYLSIKVPSGASGTPLKEVLN